MTARHKLKTAAKILLTAAAAGAAARALKGGVSGEEMVERREETYVREPYMRPDEKDRLGALPEQNIEREISRLVEGADKTRLEDLVQRYDTAIARFESEKTSGKVSESTLAEIRLLPDAIRQELGLSQQKLDELKSKVGRNITARELRRPEVVREFDRSYDVKPNLAERVGNVLLGTPATVKHVHHVEETIALPDTLPTIEQLAQEGRLSAAEGTIVGADGAQELLEKQIPPERITPKPELRQFEGELGLRQADPSQVPKFKGELDAYAEQQRRALELAERGGDPKTVKGALEEAQALMQTQIQAGLDGITMEEALAREQQTSGARKPLVESATVVSSPRPESLHTARVRAETMTMPTYERTVDQVRFEEQLGGVRSDITATGAKIEGKGTAEELRTEAARIAGILNTQDPVQMARGTEDLRAFLGQHNLTLANLRDMGVEIPRSPDGTAIVSPETLDTSAETQKQGAAAPTQAPELAGRSGVSEAGSILSGSRGAKDATLSQMQAGYGGLEQRLEAETERLRLQEAEFERLKRELEDKVRMLQANVTPSMINQNPQLREGIEDVVKNAEMQPTDENKVQALQTATLIADVELDPQKMKDGGFGRELAKDLQSGDLRDETSAFMRAQGELQNELKAEGKSVDLPTIVAAAKTYGPQNEEELKQIVREIKAKEAHNLDLKQELGTADVRRNQPDAFAEMGRILDGADTIE